MLLLVLAVMFSVKCFGVARVDPLFFAWNQNNFGVNYSEYKTTDQIVPDFRSNR